MNTSMNRLEDYQRCGPGVPIDYQPRALLLEEATRELYYQGFDVPPPHLQEKVREGILALDRLVGQ